MPILSRRTVAALAAFFGLLAASGFAAPGRAAGDNSNVVQALRAGGLVIDVRHGAAFPDQADTDPLNFANLCVPKIRFGNIGGQVHRELDLAADNNLARAGDAGAMPVLRRAS
jgi:hypothetical protein